MDAVAIDFFARTAPSEDRSEAFDFMAQVPLTKPETLQADIVAGAAYLRAADGGKVKNLYSVGFCFGGALSYLQAASGLEYAVPSAPGPWAPGPWFHGGARAPRGHRAGRRDPGSPAGARV